MKTNYTASCMQMERAMLVAFSVKYAYSFPPSDGHERSWGCRRVFPATLSLSRRTSCCYGSVRLPNTNLLNDSRVFKWWILLSLFLVITLARDILKRYHQAYKVSTNMIRKYWRVKWLRVPIMKKVQETYSKNSKICQDGGEDVG